MNNMKNLGQQIKNGEVTVVDVRTRAEFAGGHVAGSVNIPLQEIPVYLDKIRGMKNIIVCCATGNRSDQAMRFLLAQGIDSQNGGSWLDINAQC
jgi:phage shock protein E